MPSPEKMIKSVMEEIHQSTAPLSDVVENQRTIIAQNRQIIEILQQLFNVMNNRPV